MQKQRAVPTPLEQRVVNAMVEGCFISAEQAKDALARALASRRKLTAVLIEDMGVSPETISTFLSFLLKVPVVVLKDFCIRKDALTLVPEGFARRHKVLPLAVEHDLLRVAMEDPQDVQLLKTLAALTKKRIRPVLPLRGGLEEAIEANYSKVSSGA